MIPAAVIEAVAIAWAGEREWQLHSQPWRNDRLEEVGQILEAAMPNVLAAVWDEAIEAHKAWTWDGQNMDPLTNPYRSAT